MKDYRVKSLIDNIVKIILMVFTLFCASIIFFIVIFIVARGITPFYKHYSINGVKYDPVSLQYFFFGKGWDLGPTLYSVGFIIVDTLIVVFLAGLISIPLSILIALFIVKIAPKWLSKIMETTIELLASIPSIIFGLFGAGSITVMVRNIADVFGYQTAGGLSGLSAAIVLGIMILPTITMVSINSIKSVRHELEMASLALGATKTQTNFHLVLVGARSGIFSGIILGIGRALGEATAVSLVCGNALTGPSFNILDTTRTLTSTILSGLTDSYGLKYDIRFSVGIILIIVIFGTSLLLNLIKRKLDYESQD